MKTTINLTLVQMTSSHDVDANLADISQRLDKADLTRTDILILPEMFIQFGETERARQYRESADFNGRAGQCIRDWARQYNIWIVAGTVPVLDSAAEKPYARCVVIDSAGELVVHYDKIHLFDATVSDAQGRYRESDSYGAGQQPIVFDSPWGKLGLAVCYDLRFPELFRALNDQGAQLVLVPSAFTAKTGAAHWEVLCRARAIENGYFLVAVNQCGRHDEKRTTWGHSMVVDPWGVVTDVGEQPTVKTLTLNLTQVDQVRQQLPVNAHRRLR
jgi:deaminated glutathione amidase